jgi:hypothetical protein
VLVLTPRPGAVGSTTVRVVLRDSSGGVDTEAFDVVVNNGQGAPTGWAADGPVLALAIAFAGMIVLSVLLTRREPRKVRPVEEPLKKLKAQEPAEEGEALVDVKEGAEEEAPPSEEAPEAVSDVGAFLRGETEAPEEVEESDHEDDDTGAVQLGVKSAPEGASAPVAAAVAKGRHAEKTPGRLAELYLFSLKDGGLLYQVPPVGLPPLEQADENEFMQWAYDTARKSVHGAEAAKAFEWKGQNVIVGRGNAFFIVGRARGDDMHALTREIETLIAETDHNFPGTTLDWQRNDIVETVGDVLRRLVK